jgi:hypothetical protein
MARPNPVATHAVHVLPTGILCGSRPLKTACPRETPCSAYSPARPGPARGSACPIKPAPRPRSPWQWQRRTRSLAVTAQVLLRGQPAIGPTVFLRARVRKEISRQPDQPPARTRQERTDSDQSAFESYYYEYYTDTSHANYGELSSVTLRRKTQSGGEWLPIRKAKFTYYAGVNGETDDGIVDNLSPTSSGRSVGGRRVSF